MNYSMKKLLMFAATFFAAFTISQNLLFAQTKNDQTFKSLMSKADQVIVSANAVTFTDDSGRTEALTIQKRPKTVAVLYSSHSTLWVECGGKVSIGLGGKSATELYREQIGRDITQDADFIKVSDGANPSTWDIESILFAKPDLIICTKTMNGYKTIAGPAAQMNIPVIAVDYDGVQDYLKWSRVFTAINAREDLYKKIPLKTAQKVAAIIDKVPNKKVRVLALLPTAKAIKADTTHTNLGAMLEDLKAVNAVTESFSDLNASRVEINIEQIYKVNPDIILFPVEQNDSFVAKYFEKQLSSNPIWSELKAVKSGSVYFLPKKLFLFRPNRGYADAYKMLAGLLYPGTKF